MASVYIPVQNSEEEVRVALDQLPRDATDILDILKAEQAPLDLWLIIAREYFKQGKIEQFRQILEEGSSPEIDEYYADVRYERIAILNALGAYYSYLGKIETKQREKEEHFILATQYYNKASRIDMHEPSTWVGKGQLLLAKGDVDQAFAAFKIVLDGDRDNIPALLGQACVEFNRGKYSNSLEMYKRVLQVYPGCPAALDPENVEALVALGIVDLQSNEASGIRRAMEKMQRAFDVYPYCATALNYLANHFFFTGQHFLVEQLTETALAATTHGSTRAHSYYNLARSYHSKGDYEKAGLYYMASVKEVNKPQEFILPFYGLGQVQLKLGDFKSSLSNFEKAVAHIYLQLNQTTKAHEALKKAVRIDSRDPEAFLDLGELLISTDSGAALEAFKTARNLLKKSNEEVSIELLNNIGVLHFEKGEFELAQQTFKEALGDGIWVKLIDSEPQSDDPIQKALNQPMDSSLAARMYKDMQLFQDLEKAGVAVELPWDKITTLSNLARLFEQLHKTETASLLYRLILFKFPEYVDAYLRLAAIAKARNNVPLSIELIRDALEVDDKNPDALCMLGDLELKNDDWVKAKDTFRAAKDASNGKDSYATLCLGNWNYFAAVRSEKRAPKLEATHLEKSKELYTKVLVEHPANMYAANGAGVVLAEKGQFDVAKELFTQVQEAASGSVFVQMPDVWINLAHVHFAQGNFPLAIKMVPSALLYMLFTTWYLLISVIKILFSFAVSKLSAQDCKKTLLKAIHLAPSNYTLRFDTGVALQKFSASTLQKTKRTVEEVRATVAELKNAVRLFSQLSAASNLQIHGFDEKKIETHVGYCKHLLEAAKVHCDAAELEDQQNKHRLELARQAAIREEESRLAEEQKKVKLEKRKQEDELKKVMQQEQHLERIKETWKSSGSKRKDRAQGDDEEGGQSEKRKRKSSGKKRRRDKKAETHMDDQDEYEEDMANTNYYEPENQVNHQVDEDDNPQDPLAAAGLEDSDFDDDAAAPSTGRRIAAWPDESDDDEPVKRQPSSSPVRENSVDMQQSDGE
ncbi:binding protein [Artemisia annua]|uniref:Binding protein n=1 Tax=Artemisia annua TaxID=35608 RepID=A0A2U1P0A2_ARTAN|nr:binding protein [Artemisia annua]